jgi:hypothetical protein
MAGKLFFVLMLSALSVIAQDIVVSQDTFLIHNNIQRSTSPDSLTLINHGTETVTLDSLHIQFEELHAGELIFEAFYIAFAVVSDSSRIRGGSWTLDSISTLTYRYIIDTSNQMETELLTMNGGGDSIVIVHMMFGWCPWCSAVYYPAYLKGVLRFFYSNGQTIELQIEASEDLRETVRLNSSVPRYRSATNTEISHFLINGQKVSGTMEKLNRVRIRHRLLTKKHRKN